MAEQRFAWCRLQAGITPKHLASFFIAAFLTIGFAVLINTLQPHLLATFLKLDSREAGSVAGNATTIAEIFLITGAIFWGAVSDRLGRRLVYVLGLLGLAAGFAAAPLSNTTLQLYAFRCIYAIGMAAAAGMLATIVGDYVVNADRGKATGIMGLMNGLGAGLCAVLISRVPSQLQASGYDPQTAGWITYLSVAACCVVAAIFLRWGLAGPEHQAATSKRTPFTTRVREGLSAARSDFGVGLSYLTAFVARADLAIAGVFLPQWCASYYADQNITDAASEGIARGGALLGVIGASSLVAAPVFGILSDRINRATAVFWALCINCVGYGATYFVADPSSGAMLAVAAVIGAGEVAGVITTQVLVQQQAPAKIRGSVIGVFGMCGGLGIAINAWIGGQLFERWLYAGPFVWLAGLNFLVALVVLASRHRIAHTTGRAIPTALRPAAAS